MNNSKKYYPFTLSNGASVGHLIIHGQQFYIVPALAGEHHSLAQLSAKLRGSQIGNKDDFLSHQLLGFVPLGDPGNYLSSASAVVQLKL